ncbi:sensor histidine kinase [Methylobacter tundripaludum]|uniref:sensor histidine kinase n=1 Tax=Methylobacter tundripaludum TaxID=173365 RepID=UPI00068CC708|nr:ATP-binding protein [Methylobacter tundripaludum]
MRITTRLRITSTVTVVALVILAPILIWSFVEFKNAKNDYLLADTIKVNFFERASFRDQYFLYREERARMLWEKNKEAADQLLHQANSQFHREQDRLNLERLRKSIEDAAVIFHRIVNNTEILKTADGNRQVYQELDKRLYSQLLMKAGAVRDMATALQDASARRIELSYEYMTIIVGVFAFTLALTTILTSIQLDRLIRRRLEPLHDGAKIVADGDLDYRIRCGGTDEFAELALSINYMTESLQASAKQLEAEIIERKQVDDKLARAHAELEQFTRIAAHHLQEPARRLVSFAQRLQSRLPTEQLNEDAIVSLHFIEQGAARQSALVRDIQLYLAADQPRSTMETVAVTDVIAGLLEHRATLMRETSAQVDYNDAPSVYIDRPRLKDIFSILLDNALCYRHPKLTPQIRISGEAKAGRVIYRVADNGVGIPAEYRERVFGVFERLQVNDDQNSTGIGLAIVRRIIESCGGSVTIQETPGGGTTVLFDLPA